MRKLLTFAVSTFLISSVSGIDLESGGKVTIIETALQKEPKKDWPKHKAPIEIHEGFDLPTAVWRVHGGQFIAYDAGEWGGALFFQAKGKDRLKLLHKDHVDSVAFVDDGVYIVAGGLAHGREHGSVYRVWINSDLEWQSKQILFTWTGIPAVTGKTKDGAALVSITRDDSLIGEANRRVTVSLFEVRSDGSLEYLGPPKQKKESNKP